MKTPSKLSKATPGLLLLLFTLTASAHGDGGHSAADMDVDMTMMGVEQPLNATSSNSTLVAPVSYFRHTEYSYLILAHIVLMTIGWVFVLPMGVMFTIARSKLAIPVQFGFFIINSAGVLLAMVYNSKTPDLYPHNAHHSTGWFLSWVALAQICMILVTASTNLREKAQMPEEHLPFIPASSEGAEDGHWLHDVENTPAYRFSGDSGHGTEQNAESVRSHSSSSLGDEREVMSRMNRKYEQDRADDAGLSSKNTPRTGLYATLSRILPSYISSRVVGLFGIIEAIITRTILIQGFVGLTTGAVTYGGFFQGNDIFSGLAHFIKGGVFFWYGIFTLGRWAGCFADAGWAWNIKPRMSPNGLEMTRTVSAEFVESFLIFFYGSTNVFLEHLSAWGKAWSAQDMEHISITIMFIGGGMCGMFIESSNVRNLLNFNTMKALGNQEVYNHYTNGEDEKPGWQPPKSYKVSMNPIPALMVLLLGLMMSSHHQSSMVSTMIHKQWGMLLMGASFARGLTYIIFYLSPPTSFLPSRPPSELITAFCLMAGGLVFMASSRDTVKSMEYNDLDAMFVFTITMGLVSFLMAWIILTIAVKGWALRKQMRTK